ncbi:acetyl-CoA carboxylase biotin carboxylase subunit family protein [Streptomyces sp. NPDC051243]|uniref:acetyl-CoA carboxylase biotin carboxylase subunit family protein n=1 Tax=Streptomyces sp. NPDC051243 TaxID=3365646 RepID=UPI00378CD2C8
MPTDSRPPLAGADFVQLGATRDGLDPYLDCARRRGLRTVLVETAAYLRWRALLGRRPFDVELAVEQPQDPEQVRAALDTAGVRPCLLLAGFERYVYSAFDVARALRVTPWPYAGESFRPPDKAQQRAALERRAPSVRQPRFVTLGAHDVVQADALGYPQVVKPVDGGGGLGVTLVDGPAALRRALADIRATLNYGGGAFGAVMAEEFVKGPEVSLQGVAVGGRALLLSVCEKITALESVPGAPELTGFREVGHIATHGGGADDALRELADRSLNAVGYAEGPFHIDVLQGPDGPVFVEMGFRLSGGGLVALVERATGIQWAELVFRTHLDRQHPSLPDASGRAAGQVSVVSDEELRAGQALAASDAGIETLPAPHPPSPDRLTSAERELLASDLARHTGAKGRVIAVGDGATHVRSLLQPLVAPRLRG